ncbi:2-oxo-4-hydroxy-4-carboxy-5-ureidoimidazoline decarboxylase-like [Brachionichthys hirsutus]|uniref:2-oxo-4-hydroxy-4-carboxy-5-ureidoimidazoline decarboxylase-like n=1 Tax=Brachionichthys hirsutus TaxID=412623 RepID=UPI00360501C6
MDIATVNTLPYEEFVDTFGNVVERCPLIAAAVWPRRPFQDFIVLEEAIGDFIDSLPDAGQEGLLRCLPDLAGRELQNGTLSRESHEEQSAAGIDALNSADAARMARLNEEYKQRFEFPFVICARMNDKASIFNRLSERCRNERAAERARAINEVKKICHLRIQHLMHTK